MNDSENGQPSGCEFQGLWARCFVGYSVTYVVSLGFIRLHGFFLFVWCLKKNVYLQGILNPVKTFPGLRHIHTKLPGKAS